jgi:hypothetical protein
MATWLRHDPKNYYYYYTVRHHPAVPYQHIMLAYYILLYFFDGMVHDTLLYVGMQMDIPINPYVAVTWQWLLCRGTFGIHLLNEPLFVM